jgi:two-component system OmpR family response regulator
VRVLVVEDDPKLRRALERGLRLEGYDVLAAASGEDGLAQARSGQFDAVLLDLLLPDLDGFAVCRSLRAAEVGTPVLMLTALSAVPDRIRGLDDGADDYLVKPFDFGELLARLRVLIRRGPSARPTDLQVGDLRLNPLTRVVARGGREVELTEREFELLDVLARTPGRPVSRERLRAAVWRDDAEVSLNVVDVYIGYLRRKLESPRDPRLIRTVRGKGFLLDAS